MTIKGILVTLIAPMSDHIANGGEKILGNASSIKQRPDGRVYISGQKQRHALFAALDRLNQDDDGHADTYISNGDGVTTLVEKDIRADLGGFLDTNKGSYSGRRTAPLTATPAVALEPSYVGRDLLIRLKVNTDKESERGQALATREYSQSDKMLMNFHIDVGNVGVRKRHKYEKEMHVSTEYVKHIKEDERKRRVKLALEATSVLTDYANNARNATSGEPQKVLIVFDTRLSRKACRYFAPETNEAEQANILAELEKRGATYFLGDDTTVDGHSVATAYEKALTFLDENKLYDPAGGDNQILSTAEFEKGTK
jgi:CRISPR-associated protein Cst2